MWAIWRATDLQKQAARLHHVSFGCWLYLLWHRYAGASHSLSSTPLAILQEPFSIMISPSCWSGISSTKTTVRQTFLKQARNRPLRYLRRRYHVIRSAMANDLFVLLFRIIYIYLFDSCVAGFLEPGWRRWMSLILTVHCCLPLAQVPCPQSATISVDHLCHMFHVPRPSLAST